MTLLAGVAGVALFLGIEALSWWWEGHDVPAGARRPARARIEVVATVVVASLVVAGVLEGAPDADPSRVSIAVGAAAVSALLLGAGAVVRAARR